MHPLIKKLTESDQFKKDYRRDLDSGRLKLESLYVTNLKLNFKKYKENSYFTREIKCVCYDFISTEGKKMRKYHYFSKYNVDKWLTSNKLESMGDIELLVSGAEFI